MNITRHVLVIVCLMLSTTTNIMASCFPWRKHKIAPTVTTGDDVITTTSTTNSKIYKQQFISQLKIGSREERISFELESNPISQLLYENILHIANQLISKAYANRSFDITAPDRKAKISIIGNRTQSFQSVIQAYSDYFSTMCFIEYCLHYPDTAIFTDSRLITAACKHAVVAVISVLPAESTRLTRIQEEND